MINATPGMTFKLKHGAYYIFTLLKFKVIIILYNFIIGS